MGEASFCTKCGRPRAGDVLFCTGCGTRFPAQPSAEQTLATGALLTVMPPAAQETRLNPLQAAAPTQAAAPAGVGKTVALIIAGILVVLAAGGGAYALVARSSGHTTAKPPSHPSVTAGSSVASPTAQATTSPTPSPTPSPTSSATPSPSPTQTGSVQVAAGVASSPEEPQVEAYLNSYFNSINTHNYNEYNSLLDAQGQQSDSQSGFDSGFATTKDSNEILTGIQDTGGGNVTATVTFASRQDTADSVDGSACNDWQISLFLAPQGNSYVMTAAPAGYHAAYTDC